MSIFSRLTKKIFKLDSSEKEIKPSPRRFYFHSGTDSDYDFSYKGKSEKETEVGVRRVPSIELETMYYMDPIIFNGVNLYVKSVLTGYEVRANDEKVKVFFEIFCKKVGLESLLGQVVQHVCIYGNAFLEIIYNKGKTEIMDLDIIDPKTMDFERDALGRVLLDKDGKVQGYIQNKGKGNEVKFTPNEIAHFKIYSIGDSFLGVGLVEPLYKTVQIKMNIEEGIGQNIYRHGFPLFKARLGDEKHEPTPEEINQVGESLRDISYKTEFTLPYYYDLEILESEKVEKLKEHMDYFTDKQVAGLGIPRAILLGLGEETNKATLEVQNMVWERTLNTIRVAIASTVEHKIFKIISDLKNFKETPTIVWSELTSEGLSAKAERLTGYVAANLLTPTPDIEKLIRKWENLPEKMPPKQEEIIIQKEIIREREIEREPEKIELKSITIEEKKEESEIQKELDEKK